MTASRSVRYLVAATAVLVAGAPAAVSAPRPACNLVRDAAGDEKPVPSAENDLLTGDIATSGTTVTGVVRPADLRPVPPTHPGGSNYFVMFRIGASGRWAYLQAIVSATGERFYAGRLDGTPDGYIYYDYSHPVQGVVDRTRKEVRISAPMSLFTTFMPLRKGARIHDIRLRSSLRELPYTEATPGFTRGADLASGGSASYVAGSPSCVPVGR